MDSFGNSSMQGSSVPMNPMMAMIQRQQQEQQQYEALTAGTTMGVTNPNATQNNNTNNNNNNSILPSTTMVDNNPSYMNTSFAQDAFQQRQLLNPGSLQQRLPQQQQLMNEMSTMYSQARSSYPDMNSIPMQQQQQQQQLMFNVGNLSPSHSPAPNHTQFYSNVDIQPSYYSDPSMADLQTSYMSMAPPAFMSSAMDSVSSTYLQQSMPSTMMQQYHNNYPNMSYSPVPQMFMASSNVTGGADTHFPPTSTMKLGYSADPTGSNLTSMPVQAPSTVLPSVSASEPAQPRRDSSSKGSPTTPTHPPSTIPPDTAAPAVVTYIPKTRQVETYGGVDLKYFDKFEIRPAVPCWEELGVVDVTALTMSLRSGTKMEVTNALNTLTTLTMQPRPLLLAHCDGLLDSLLDHLQATMLPPDATEETSQTYAELFERSLLEMKSLIPSLAPTSSEEWASSRERRLCLLTILRNVSFMEENIDYLATHPRLCPVLVGLIQLTRRASDLQCIDLLEFRKSVLTIYANIAIATPPCDMDAWVYLIHDFMVHGTDTYYAMLAMEAWNKCAVHESHRRILLHSNQATVTMIQGIWAALISMLRRQFQLVEMGMMVGLSSSQLGTLELVMMGLYNVVALADIPLCDDLVMLEPGVAMTLLRICLTLAEANNHHFRVVAQRGMETVYTLVLGGGLKVTQLIHQQRNHYYWQQKQQANQKKQQMGMVVFPMASNDLEDEEPNYKHGVANRAQRLLHQAVLQEKLMMAMLKPAADLYILSGLDDLLTLMADMVFDD